MIYELPASSEPIRQGDIFQYVPRIDFDLAQLPIVAGENTLLDDWSRASANVDTVTALVAMRKVTAIVITQDCDAVRIEDIALCEISPFEIVEPMAKGAKYPSKTVSMITKHARINLKWFYLPPDPRMGFANKMAVDFQSVLRVSRLYLDQNLSQMRIGRLNEMGAEHFRERLSEYFRRYPYDEWYPLDKAELEEYRKNKPEPIEPFSWQI